MSKTYAADLTPSIDLSEVCVADLFDTGWDVLVCTVPNPLKLPGKRYHMIPDSSVIPLHDFRLTVREEEIAALLATGLTAKQIALQLKIANETVRSHTRSIYLKLRVKSKVELAGKIFRMQQQRSK